MSVRPRLLALLLGLCAACGQDERSGVGIVREARADLRQVVLEHEEIPGVMPAMTMSFDVADPALLADLAPGDRVRFTLDADATRFRITALEKLSGAEPAANAGASGGGLDDVVPEADPAPPFALVDQDGRSLSLEALRGEVVLLDFVYTSCPGPCPLLTSSRVRVQRALPEPLRPRVRFVSISLDPLRDTPEALRGYALARGADLTRWSFLTGEPATVDAVLESYGVGTVREPSGEIQHVVVTFLIDAQGRIAKRYFGLDHDTSEYLRDLSANAK